MVYEHILVPLNGSSQAENVLPQVEKIAQGGLTQKITFVHVLKAAKLRSISDVNNNLFVNEIIWESVSQRDRSNARYYFQKLSRSLKCIKPLICWEILPAGGIAASIVRYAEENGVDLIIMASQRRKGIQRWLWGSITDQVMSAARMPVLILKTSET